MASQSDLSAAGLAGLSDDPLLKRLLEWLPQLARPCYLVGGAVRDCVLRGLAETPGRYRPPALAYDLDLLVPAGGVRIARQLADRLGAAFYALDPVRDVGRAVFRSPDCRDERRIVDVAAFQGATLLEDLAGRDFSINAMAVDLTHSPFSLIDPTGGLADLRAGRLRAASPQSLYRDAVRALRAVRMRARFGFEIEPDTVDLIRDAAPRLAGVSAERVRDELVKILGLPGAAESLRTLAALRLLDVVLPELTPLKGLPQPHRTVDGFDHTLQVVADLEQLLPPGGRPSADLPYADRLVTHLSTGLPGSQDRRSLLTVAALLHDIGKPATYSVGDDGAVHYFDHDRVGAGMAAALLERLRFSRPAIGWVTTVVRHHLRPLLLARAPAVTRRAVHRFFRDTGAAGVDVVLLSLADHPPATETAPGDQSGATQQAVAATLLEAWFVGYAEVIMPRPLLSGGDIVRRLGMTPGPLVGELQRDLQEAQAAGEVVTPEQAEAWVRSRLETR